MTNSEASSNKSATLPSWLPICFLIFSAIGFVDATYLTVKHYLGMPIPCVILQGCEQVTNSQFATIFGAPVALLGSGYYLTVLILSVIFLDTRKLVALKLAAFATFFGILASLWFVFLQIFIIKAICLYCLISATTSTLLFICGLIFFAKNKPEMPGS